MTLLLTQEGNSPALTVIIILCSEPILDKCACPGVLIAYSWQCRFETTPDLGLLLDFQSEQSTTRDMSFGSHSFTFPVIAAATYRKVLESIETRHYLPRIS